MDNATVVLSLSLSLTSFLSHPFFLLTGSRCAAQAGLKLLVLLLQPPVCWDYQHAPPCPATVGLLRSLSLVTHPEGVT
jgi:hypothetical protein